MTRIFCFMTYRTLLMFLEVLWQQLMTCKYFCHKGSICIFSWRKLLYWIFIKYSLIVCKIVTKFLFSKITRNGVHLVRFLFITFIFRHESIDKGVKLDTLNSWEALLHKVSSVLYEIEKSYVHEYITKILI